MATIGFQDFFASLERVGFVDVLLPFLLVFTIIFAICNLIMAFSTWVLAWLATIVITPLRLKSNIC